MTGFGAGVVAAWPRAIPAGVKLAGLALAGAGLVWVTDPAWLALAFGLVLAAGAAARALPVLAGLWPLGVMLALAFAAHFAIGDVALGAAVCLRIATLLCLATLVSGSTELSQMMRVLDRLLAPLRWLGLSTRPVTVALAMALRFAPMLSARWGTLGQAWRARAPRRPGWRLLVPFTVSALDDADRAATALAARGAFAKRSS